MKPHREQILKRVDHARDELKIALGIATEYEDKLPQRMLREHLKVLEQLSFVLQQQDHTQAS